MDTEIIFAKTERKNKKKFLLNKHFDIKHTYVSEEGESLWRSG